jgi:hypothetical protein
MNRPRVRTDDELPFRLRELVDSVGVERMSRAGVQRRVVERARRRRARRGLGSAAFVVALFVAAGAWTAGGGTASRVVTRGPIVPAATQDRSGAGGGAPADATTVSTAQPASQAATPTTVPPTAQGAPQTATTAGPDTVTTGRDGAGGRAATPDAPTTRGPDSRTAADGG